MSDIACPTPETGTLPDGNTVTATEGVLLELAERMLHLVITAGALNDRRME